MGWALRAQGVAPGSASAAGTEYLAQTMVMADHHQLIQSLNQGMAQHHGVTKSHDWKRY